VDAWRTSAPTTLLARLESGEPVPAAKKAGKRTKAK
jgi:hypothetical protein